MRERKRKKSRASSDDDAEYTPQELRSQEERATRKRAAWRSYYAQHPEYRESKRLRMQVIRQKKKQARRRWDPPKIIREPSPSSSEGGARPTPSEGGYAASGEEFEDEEGHYEPSITEPAPRMGPSPTASEIVGESYDGQLPTLWKRKLDEIKARESAAEAVEREEFEVKAQQEAEARLREQETIASQVLSSLYKASAVALPPTPPFAALAASSPLPPSSPPPLSTPDLDFAPRIARAPPAGGWTSSPMTSLPIATPSPDPPPRRRQANQRNGREPRPRWQTPEYDGPEEMLTLTPRKLFADILKARRKARGGRS